MYGLSLMDIAAIAVTIAASVYAIGNMDRVLIVVLVLLVLALIPLLVAAAAIAFVGIVIWATVTTLWDKAKNSFRRAP